jgi:Ca2+-binding RTX toxin-like protein
MVCGAGLDVMAGNDGDDTMVWNNGDGTDVMHGEAGDDVAEVNGSPGGDDFTVERVGGRVRFDRVNLVPFGLYIGTTERLVVNAGRGDVRITGRPGVGALIAGIFRGQSGDDRITGTGAEDRLSGGSGRDVIRARDGAADTVACGRGADVARVERRDRVRGCERLL